MAKKRKFCAYRRLERAYTRKSKYRKKSFVRASPQNKVVRFDMGNLTKKNWEYSVCLVSKDNLNIRDNALEASRQTVNKHLETIVGKENYFFRIRVFPHHMLRENPLASGAGADRMSTGMKMSFGKVVGIAARVPKGKVVFEVKVDKANVLKAKQGIAKAMKKLPSSFQVTIEEIEKPEQAKATIKAE